MSFVTSICFGAGPAGGWTFALPITGPLVLVALLYAAGAWRLWRRSARGRAIRLRQAGLFLAGWGVLAAALVTPLHRLGESLFTAHMIEHELMMAVAAPLIAASAPLAALLWALPLSWRQAIGGATHAGAMPAISAFFTRPVVATVLHGAAIWIWHIPFLFEAALHRGGLHYLQHASFLGTALLFWWVLLPHPGSQGALGGAVMHLFVTSMHTGLLGVLLVLSPRLWYPQNDAGAALWGLTPLEDQQLAGLVMWVLAGLIYGGAALLLAGLWIRSSGKRIGGGAYAVPAA